MRAPYITWAGVILATLPTVFVINPVSSGLVAQERDAACIVSTPAGSVRGLSPGEERTPQAGPDRGAACVYLGIPYAAPPVGQLRWKPPQPAPPWAPAILSATASRQCPQISAPSVPAGVVAGNEDCLLLNVWAPRRPSTTRLPVLVWFHTGAFQAASAVNAASIGERFAQDRNVIIVAPNYRLGPFGFLAHSALTLEDSARRTSGNYGLLDQRAALVWVRDHITAFGGDPNNVTIAGTSAGSHSVSFHVVSPGSAGLFHRAIMQSGSASWRWPDAAEGEAQGMRFSQALGCADVGTAACLRAKTADDVLRALPIDQQKVVEPSAVSWGPIIDRVEVPDQPRDLYRLGRFTKVPIIIGTNGDEGWTFVDRSFPAGLDVPGYENVVRNEFGAIASVVLRRYPASAFPSPKDALSQLTGDAEFVCEARRVARLVSRARVPVWVYSFAYTIDAVTPGRAVHGLEPNLLFGNNFGAPSNHVLTSSDLRLFQTMSGYWSRFAERGTPDSSDAVQWPMFAFRGYPLVSERYLVLDDTVAQVERLNDRRCDFWEQFYFRSMVGPVPAGMR